MVNEMLKKNYNERTIAADTRQFEQDFIDTIHEKLGLEIHKHQVNLMIKTVMDACKHFNCTPDYFLSRLNSQDGATPEIEYLTNGITIGETYFFRDKKQMKIVSEMLLPALIAEKRKNNKLSLRIWSAGCSSGEEIYSIAMYLNELLKDLPKWKISLIGTDINVNQLRKAAHGEYSEWSMRSIPSYFKDNYFTVKKNKFFLHKKIMEMVEFSYLNLNEEGYPSLLNNTNAQDLVLCRNVLIYFEEKNSKKILERLASCLEDEGYLMLGASDPLYILSKMLTVNPDCATLFRKTAFVPVRIKPVEKINKPPISSQYIPTEPPKVKTKVVEKEIIDVSKQIDELIKKEMWHELVETIEFHGKKDLDQATGHYYALALANIGRQGDAVVEFDKLLSKDKTNVDIYLSYALTMIELNRLMDAEKLFRQAIFLDRKSVIAHFQLGTLLLRAGKKNEGIRALKNALDISKKVDPNAVILGGNGLWRGRCCG